MSILTRPPAAVAAVCGASLKKSPQGAADESEDTGWRRCHLRDDDECERDRERGAGQQRADHAPSIRTAATRTAAPAACAAEGNGGDLALPGGEESVESPLYIHDSDGRSPEPAHGRASADSDHRGRCGHHQLSE